MFLVDLTFVDSKAITEQLTEQHRTYLSAQYQQGVLMFGGRKQPRTGGLLLSKHQSEASVVAMMEQDPFITSGVATYEITEFVPVMASEKYADLLPVK